MGNASTYIDIAILFVIVLSAILGWRKGILATLFSFVRWLICILVAVFGASSLCNFFYAKTDLPESLSIHIENSIAFTVSNTKLQSVLPDAFKNMAADASIQTAEAIGDKLAKVLMLIFCFFIVLIIAAIITGIILRILEHYGKHKKSNPIGLMNGILGGVFGLFRGVIIVSVIMLLFIPFVTNIDPDASKPMVSAIRNSYLGGFFYDKNPITTLLEKYF
ncbi:MAG: CvpA family protein [Eubacterium sp.]